MASNNRRAIHAWKPVDLSEVRAGVVVRTQRVDHLQQHDAQAPHVDREGEGPPHQHLRCAVRQRLDVEAFVVPVGRGDRVVLDTRLESRRDDAHVQVVPVHGAAKVDDLEVSEHLPRARPASVKHHVKEFSRTSPRGTIPRCAAFVAG